MARKAKVTEVVVKKAAQKKPKKQRPKKKANKQPKAKQPMYAGRHLSPCTAKYVAALADPWADANVAPCIPDVPSYPSKKVRIIIRGSGATSSSTAPYTGFVWGCPEKWLAGDGAKAFVTSSTFAGSSFQNSGTTGVSAVNASTDYTVASLDATRAYRLVAAGIRVRYIGTLANAGGVVAGLLEPTHGDLTNKTYSNLRSYQYVREYPFGERWVALTYSPYATTDSTYLAYASRSSNGYMGVMIQSAANSAPFDYEIVAHYEMFGSAINDGSRDGMDPVGYAAALEVAQQGETVSATVGEPGFLASLANSAKSAVEEVAAAMSGTSRSPMANTAGRAMKAYLERVAGPALTNTYGGTVEL